MIYLFKINATPLPELFLVVPEKYARRVAWTKFRDKLAHRFIYGALGSDITRRYRRYCRYGHPYLDIFLCRKIETFPYFIIEKARSAYQNYIKNHKLSPPHPNYLIKVCQSELKKTRVTPAVGPQANTRFDNIKTMEYKAI